MVLLLALQACKKPIQEPIYHDYPELTISSEWLDFGALEQGETAVRSFTIQNTGDLPMGVSAIYEGKGMEENFEVSWQKSNIVCPATEEADTGSSDEGGAAEGPPGPPVPTISVSATDSDGDGTLDIDFGAVAAGDNAVNYLTLENTGADPLSLTAVSLANQGAGFTLLGDLSGASLNQGEKENLYIQFDAVTADPAETQLIVVSNDPSQGILTVDLLANQVEDTDPVDTGDPPDDTNDPTDDTGDPDAPAGVLFVLDKDCKVPIDVTFTPVGVDAIFGSIILETKSDAADEPTFHADLDRTRAIVYLEGESEHGDPRVVVRPRTVDFGHVWTELEEVRYIEVANIGDGDLTLTEPTLDDNCAGAFDITWSYTDEDTGTKVLPGGHATLLEVTFSPEDTSGAYCVLQVHSDDAENPDVNVQLQGNAGKDPENEPPTVVIRSPEAGYVHNTNAPIELELNIFDVNQPATSLLCKVRSAVQISASVANCTPTEASGHVIVEVPMDPFDPGVDTLLVQVIDTSQAVSYASVSIVYLTDIPDSDDDGDGYGDNDTGLYEDCDDSDINTYPRAAEIYDGKDNDCDFLIDEGTAGADDDGDSFTEADGDCDDADADSYPNAPESPDHRDNNCDGTVDEDTTLYDDDGDGYAEVNNDCHDGDASINPGGREICDNLDNDCNGKVDDGCVELNSEPMVIGGIWMSQTACEPGEQVQLTMFVYDADGQELSYVWTAGDNATIDNLLAERVNWQAPSAENVGEGVVVQVYAVAQDVDQHQVWDFAEIAVYPVDQLYTQFVEVILVEPESNCSVAGGAAGLGLALAGLAAALRRRED